MEHDAFPVEPVVARAGLGPVQRQRDRLAADPLTRDRVGQRAGDRGGLAVAPVAALTESDVGVVTVTDCDVLDVE